MATNEKVSKTNKKDICAVKSLKGSDKSQLHFDELTINAVVKNLR